MIKNEVPNLQDNDALDSLKSDVIISVINTNGMITYANTNFYKVFGKAQKTQGVLASQLLKLLVHSRTDYLKICQTIMAGFKWEGVLYLKDLNDKTHCLESTISPIKDDDGIVAKYVAISNDISGNFCNVLNTFTIHKDENQLIETITNHALCITKQGKIFNTKTNDLINANVSLDGANVYDFINPINLDYFRNQITAVFSEGKTRTYQSLGFNAKGNQVFYVTKIKPVFNLMHEVIYATLKSKKHKSGIGVNQRLKAVETKYTNILQSINVGIIVVANNNGIIIEWNKGAEKAFGYAANEVIGEHLTIIISEKHVDKGLQEILKVKDKLDQNLVSPSIEMIGLKKDGHEFPLEFTMSHWQNGKEKFYCAVMIDMTKHKKLEAKLKKTTKDLELFLYRSAHDLKAPLTSAEGLLLLLKDEKIPDSAMEMVNMVDETLKKGRLLLEDLALASIISEKRREITPIKFEQKVANAMAVLKEAANFDSVNFQFDINQKADFSFNRELMDFILQNLIHNVICFVRPKTSVHDPKANVSVEVTDEELRIIVSDNGIGINNNNLDKVFDLYFSDCKTDANSTGLGLYIVKRIVEEFCGEITVKSELNEGTSFEVVLPNIKEENLSYD